MLALGSPHGSAPRFPYRPARLADRAARRPAREPLADVRALADDDDLLGCGLDSIRLMYLQERLRARGSTLDFAQLAQRPCLGAWLDLLACADRLSAPATVALPTAQDRDQPFELSSVQQAYWLGRGAGEVLGNVSCHAFLEFRARDVDPQRWPRRRSACVNATRCCGRASSTVASRSFRRRRCPASTCRTGDLAGGRGRARLAGAARLARP